MRKKRQEQTRGKEDEMQAKVPTVCAGCAVEDSEAVARPAAFAAAAAARATAAEASRPGIDLRRNILFSSSRTEVLSRVLEIGPAHRSVAIECCDSTRRRPTRIP